MVLKTSQNSASSSLTQMLDTMKKKSANMWHKKGADAIKGFFKQTHKRGPLQGAADPVSVTQTEWSINSGSNVKDLTFITNGSWQWLMKGYLRIEIVAKAHFRSLSVMSSPALHRRAAP